MGGKRLRFRFSNVISRVLLINLKRSGRVKPAASSKKKYSADDCPSPSAQGVPHHQEEEASLICNPPPKPMKKLKQSKQQKKKGKGPVFRYSCCKQNEAVHESCHYKRVPASAAVAAAAAVAVADSTPKSQQAEEEEEAWEREGFWNVIAEVDNKVVKKKVVLKKRASSKKLLRLPVISSDSECTSSAAVASKSCEILERIKSSSASHQLQQGSSTFRLSTSSGDASLGPESFAWDKEHSLFASDDSVGGSTKLNHRVMFPEEEDFALKNNRGAVRRKSTSSLSSGSSSFRHSSSSTCFPAELGQQRRKSFSATGAEEASQCQEKVLLLRSSSCTPSFDRKINSSSSSRRLAALESNAKLWEDGRSFTGGGDFTNGGVLPPRNFRNAEDRSEVLPKKKKKQQQQQSDKLMPSAVRGKVRESVPVMLFSSDPYQDFKQSMVRMIFEKRLNKAADLEELLECYLYLNPPAFHEVIVQVFTDLWIQALEAEQSSSRSSSFQTVTGSTAATAAAAAAALRRRRTACSSV